MTGAMPPPPPGSAVTASGQPATSTPAGRPGGRWARARRSWWVRIPALLAVLAFAAGGVLVFGEGWSYVPPEADAIVVLGGSDDRARLGEDLRRLGVSERLVVSIVQGARSTRELTAATLCREAGPQVTCFSPDPPTTRGEAAFVARLAEREEWGYVVVVTAAHHGRRAKMLFDQCVDARIEVIGSRRPTNLFEDAWHVIHETGGILDLLRDPECPDGPVASG